VTGRRHGQHESASASSKLQWALPGCCVRTSRLRPRPAKHCFVKRQSTTSTPGYGNTRPTQKTSGDNTFWIVPSQLRSRTHDATKSPRKMKEVAEQKAVSPGSREHEEDALRRLARRTAPGKQWSRRRHSEFRSRRFVKSHLQKKGQSRTEY